MKPIRIAAIILTLLAVFSLTWSATGLSAWGESPASTSMATAQLLTNPDMEQTFVPYGFEFEGVACKVAASWTRFGDTNPRPCWMDAREFAHYVMNTIWVEKIKGETSQVVISTDPYAAGIYQTVSVTKGLPYGFHAAMMTIYQSSYGPPQPGHMIKQVGMDPTGGTDPNASTVVWSEPSDQDYGWDLRRRTAVVATSGTMTVFIRVIGDDPGNWPYVNQSYLDAALLAQTATAWISSPEITPNETFIVRWGAVASPDAVLDGYDVQWQDQADGEWHEWIEWVPKEPQAPPPATEASFSGERGHTYRFRVRAWQYYPDARNYLYSPWSETANATTIAAAQLAGEVRGNGPYSFSGARVSLVGTPYEAMSRQDGSYQMWTEPMDDPHAVTVSDPPWLSPEPVYGVTFGPIETVTLDWTLRPPDDAVANGGFEGDLSGWDTVSEQGVEPAVVTDPVHTGLGAAMLGGQADAVRAVGYATGVEQTVALARSWSPNLSFWFLPESTDGDDLFEVTLTVVSDTASSDPPGEAADESVAIPLSLAFTPLLDADGWQHQWYSLGADDAYFTGTVTIHFEVWNDGDESPTTVYLDEASVGRTPGGPFRTYLPLISR